MGYFLPYLFFKFPVCSIIKRSENSSNNFSSLPIQESLVCDKMESSADGEDDGSREEQNKLEEGCESSLGSSEQLPDSDSELEESSQRTRSLTKQESEVSMDDDQLSYRDSLDLSSQCVTHTDPEQDVDQDHDHSKEGDAPALPNSVPPDDSTVAEQDLTASLAELNVNQSNNNNQPYSPILSLSGLPLARLCGKKLPLTRNRDEPEFV